MKSNLDSDDEKVVYWQGKKNPIVRLQTLHPGDWFLIILTIVMVALSLGVILRQELARTVEWLN